MPFQIFISCSCRGAAGGHRSSKQKACLAMAHVDCSKASVKSHRLGQIRDSRTERERICQSGASGEERRTYTLGVSSPLRQQGQGRAGSETNSLAMHIVGVGSFGARIIARSSSSACGSPMAALKMMSLVHTPGAALTHHSAESFSGRNRILGARCWPGVGFNRSWSLQIRGDAGLAVSDASKTAAQSGAFVDGLLLIESEAGPQPTSSQVIFLGTGTSEGIPRVSCLTNPEKSCAVCLAAAELGNKNRRRNTSLMVRYLAPDGRLLNILIDAGKFFYHSALQWFPYYGIRNLAAVIITHAHADANGGLDDLRDWTNNVQPHIPIYVGLRDLTVMAKSHYYLVDTSVVMKGTAVTKLQFIPMSEETFEVHGLKVTPLPVWHGSGYRSLGFRFGDVCYISDASEIPAETYPLLKNCDLLILDALRPDRSSATHFGMPAALDEVRKIRPKRTLFTGMMHTMDHDKINAELAKLLDSEGLDVQLSFDGMQIPIDL